MLDINEVVCEVKTLVKKLQESECFVKCKFEQVQETPKSYRLFIDFPNCMGELMINEPECAPYHFVKFEAIADILGVPTLVVSWYSQKYDTLEDIALHLAQAINSAAKY